MMTRLIHALAAAGVFLAANGAYSQAPPAQDTPPAVTSLRGTVVRVEGQDRIILKTTDNREITLMSTPTTRYVIDGRAGRFADIRTGVNLSATYNLQNNQYLVSSVQVGDAPNVAVQPGQPGINDAPPPVTTLRGKVVRVEGQDRIILKTTDNREITLMSTPTTRYVIDGKAGRFADIRTGVNLSATYNLQNNQYLVSSVQVGDAPNVVVQPGQPGINERRFRGRVVTVNATNNQIVAKSQDGNQVTLFVQKNGRFLRGGQAVRFADVQVGTLIEAQYLERDGHWWVDEVILVTDNAAANPPPAGDATQVQGTVVRIVGQNQVVIKTSDNKELTIDLVPQTVYTFDNQPAQFRDIQTGQDLRIQYTTRDRRSIASRIIGIRRK